MTRPVELSIITSTNFADPDTVRIRVSDGEFSWDTQMTSVDLEPGRDPVIDIRASFFAAKAESMADGQ